MPVMLDALLPWIPSGVLGGIPMRRSSTSVLNLLAAFEPDPNESHLPSLYGIAVDASKCFDRIAWSQMWALLISVHAPPSVIRSMSSFYLAHSRHTHIRGTLDKVGWSVSSGLLQGCPLSVLCTVLLVSTWHISIPESVQGQSYIDDRLMLSTTLAPYNRRGKTHALGTLLRGGRSTRPKL